MIEKISSKWKWCIKDGNGISFGDEIEYDNLSEAQAALLNVWGTIYYPQLGTCYCEIDSDNIKTVSFVNGKWIKERTLMAAHAQVLWVFIFIIGFSVIVTVFFVLFYLLDKWFSSV